VDIPGPDPMERNPLAGMTCDSPARPAAKHPRKRDSVQRNWNSSRWWNVKVFENQM
jgi:anti-sigma-K factor RskA